MAKKVHRYVAGQKGSSTRVDDEPREARTVDGQDYVTTRGEERGVFVRGADYLLSRLPFTKYKYQEWSKTKRVIVGYLLWLVVLPVIPLAIMAIMWARDPQGFKKSPAFAILSAVTVAWFGLGLGYVNSQVPVDITDGQVTRSAQEKVKDQSTSNATGGKYYENCTAAFNDGVFDIPRSDPSYRTVLDRDGDGLACER